MKIFHLSDLHLGKRVNEFSMLEQQEYILTLIINLIDEEKPQAVVIAGDVYDKAVPPAEAVQLFDSFLFSLAKRSLTVLVISGNHDSPERIAFGSRLMNRSGVYLSPVYDGQVTPVTLTDEHGEVDFYLLPFIKPSHVRRFFPDSEINTYTDAVCAAIHGMSVNTERRNVLVTHQFVTGADRCESEDISVGGSDNVDAAAFEPFDYVALGHIHSPQNVGKSTVRYCGTPLKYSFSEVNHKKSVTVVELGGKGDVDVRTLPLAPKHDMREIKGSYMELTAKSFYDGTNVKDFLHVTLTDEADIPDAIGKLRAIYPNIMKLDYDNCRTRHNNEITGAQAVQQKTPLELFGELYEKQNNQPLNSEQSAYAAELIERIWEDKE